MSGPVTADNARKQVVTLGLLSLGTFGFFCLAALLEEYIFKANNKEFKFGWFLTFIQLVFVTSFSCVERLYFKEKVWAHNADLKRHGVVAAAMTASRGLTNMSLQFLSYPTQVVFKSLKLLTVMIGSALFVGRKYKRSEYVATGFVVISALLFGFGDLAGKATNANGEPESSPLGFFIVILSLVADSMHSNTQETLLQDFKSTVREAMVYTNFFAAIFTLCVCIVTTELFSAIQYCFTYPDTWLILGVQSLITYLGVLCFVTMIKQFGAVLATTVTTVRKIVTVTLSFIFFAKPFNTIYLTGIFMFVVSFLVQSYVQYQQIQQGLGLGKNLHNQQHAAQTKPQVGDKKEQYQQIQQTSDEDDDQDTDIELELDLVDHIVEEKQKSQ